MPFLYFSQMAQPIATGQWSPHRQEPVAPFKNATSREFRIPPPAGAGGFQFAGIDNEVVWLLFLLIRRN
jgi:hypothetical protein